MLFLLLVNLFYDVKCYFKWRIYIDKLLVGVMLDFLDSIDILEILFIDDVELKFLVVLENVIIVFVCINFFLFILVLFELSVIVKGEVCFVIF